MDLKVLFVILIFATLNIIVIIYNTQGYTEFYKYSRTKNNYASSEYIKGINSNADDLYGTLVTDNGYFIHDMFACYKSNDTKKLPDILNHTRTNKNIIVFLETSCKSRYYGKIHLNQRQACSIESAALHHPKSDIYVLITAPVTFGNTTDFNDKLIHQLLKYKNIKFFHINVENYFEDTPVRDLYHSGKLEVSPYFVTHFSDVLRFVTLWRFEATYIDMDVIVMRNLNTLGPNYCARETSNNVGSAVFRIGDDEKGRKWIRMLLEDLNESYLPFSWAHNSNGLLQRLLNKICKVQTVLSWNKKICSGFQVYPKHVFYPIGFNNWYQYFEEKYKDNTTSLISRSRAVHFWNKLSETRKIKIGTFKSALELIALEHCPNIYGQLVDEF